MAEEQKNLNENKDKDQFLEFRDEYRERDKVKLRETYFGEDLSQKEIQRYLLIKERLNRLLMQKKEQQGFMYVLHLKNKNLNIDEEIKETGDEYSELLAKIRGKTGYSNDQVEEFIEGRRIKKIRYYLIELNRENDEEIKDKSEGKRNLFLALKDKAKEKRAQSLIGVGLIGLPINVPYNGIISFMVSGLRSEFFTIPFNLKDKNANFFLLKEALIERKSLRIKGDKLSFEINDYSLKEFELRNIKIKTSDFDKKNEEINKKQAINIKKIKPFENINEKKPKEEEFIVENFSSRTQADNKK
ncbi:MAG: hypothetical protein PHI45_00140 [Candidatus Pacebacteria bacterium]|nr:hypothetical protein [Candidatus Paceibacterota bacterium]MDD5012903.1 hypothetical protein [Candidatus Paceibacterota bacterium]MDD5752487.1 hypothetical protein [Candidatus Paceibacterota bacterium]